jgi:hypothetical protein
MCNKKPFDHSTEGFFIACPAGTTENGHHEHHRWIRLTFISLVFLQYLSTNLTRGA